MSTDTLPARVYANYRAALKQYSGNHGLDSRAGARKQAARQVTADRYKLPISQVKAIVRQMDAERGITHEHPADYLVKLELQQRCDAIFDAYRANPTGCACGNYQGVRVRLNYVDQADPGQPVPLLSCFLCYLETGNWQRFDRPPTEAEIAERDERLAQMRIEEIAKGTVDLDN